MLRLGGKGIEDLYCQIFEVTHIARGNDEAAGPCCGCNHCSILSSNTIFVSNK